MRCEIAEAERLIAPGWSPSICSAACRMDGRTCVGTSITSRAWRRVFLMAARSPATSRLHNDALFSLLMVSQLVIDIAGELSARRGDRFEDYTVGPAHAKRPRP